MSIWSQGVNDKSREVPVPKEGGRSGVAKSETLEEKPPVRDPFGRMEHAFQQLAKTQAQLEKLLLDVKQRERVRENSHVVKTWDTNAAPLTNSEGDKLDVATIFGGVPAHSLSVNSDGGGALQVNLNGCGWLDATTGDFFDNETIYTLAVRVTAGSAGTARLRLGARLEA